MEKLFNIVDEDAEFLVINKPAGLVCHPTKTDEYSSLIGRVRLYLGKDSRPQLINRLDRETSGLTVIAKDLDVARQVRQLWENRKVEKEYLAIVHGNAPPHEIIEAPLGKDERSAVAIKDCVQTGGAHAKTEYWLKFAFENLVPSHNEAEGGNNGGSQAGVATRSFSLLRVVPHTGRKHQIRIHLAHAGHPVVGDKIYGGNEDLYLALVENRLTPRNRSELILPHHGLHAARLSFEWHGALRVFSAEPEPWFKAFCSLAAIPD